jgi:glycosyltransferase involved in cell wall biosynthesis
MNRPPLAVAANAVPKAGGQGLNLFHMTEYLRPAFDVTVYCRAEYPGLPTRIIPPGRLATFVWSKPFVRRLRDWQALHHNAGFDRAVARSLPPGGAVFHGAVGQSLHSLRAARRLGYRAVLDVVTLHADEFRAAQVEGCRTFGIRPAMHPREYRRILGEYEDADLIRVMSHVAARTFTDRGFPADKVVVAQPPFDPAEFPEATFAEPVFRVCYVGLIEPWKGFHHLVEAFDRLRLPAGELVLWGGCGSRPVTDYMTGKMAANPAIRIRPVEIRKAGLAEVYGRASVLVLPSLADGFGYVAGEAMASGLPVITTTKAGAADLVADGVNGYLVAPGDVGAIADRLAHLAKNPDLTRRMGRAARETIRQRPDAAALGAAYAGRVRGLLAA